MYAGRDPTNVNRAVYYDDIYVLSLPSFTWIKVFSGKIPRFGHTCHLVGGRQMLTVGGHNKNPNSCDWEKKVRHPYHLVAQEEGFAWRHTKRLIHSLELIISSR
jgi:hypothetical protein